MAFGSLEDMVLVSKPSVRRSRGRGAMGDGATTKVFWREKTDSGRC